MKHKHAELIKAWADGAEIQSRWDTTNDTGWSDWCDENESPEWFIDWEYRIKPEEKKPVVRWQWIYRDKVTRMIVRTDYFFTEAEAKRWSVQQNTKLFLRAKWTRTEFEE